jgi:hypothetical protein
MNWIPVKERLPEKLQDVFVYIPDFCPQKIYNAYWTEHFLIDDTVEKVWLANGYCCKHPEWSFEDITHWMPLPKPPKD